MGAPYLQDANNIAAGWMHSLVLDINGFVWAWGDDHWGQLGDNQQSGYQSATPVQVHDGEMNTASGYLEDIISISAGRSGRQSLALDADNFVYAWGYNKYGQCGNNDSNNNELTPVRVLRGQQPQDTNNPSIYIKHIIAISAGADHSMSLEKLDPNDPNCNGYVYTWGSNKWPGDGEEYQPGRGKLGNRSTVDLNDTPLRVLAGQQDPNDPNAFLENIVAISAGWNHCMVLENDDPYDPNIYNPAYTGRVFTWGNNGPGWGGGGKKLCLNGFFWTWERGIWYNAKSEDAAETAL